MDEQQKRVTQLREQALKWVGWSPLFALPTGRLSRAIFEEAMSPATHRAESAYEKALNEARSQSFQDASPECCETDECIGTGGAQDEVIDEEWVKRKCRECLPPSYLIEDVTAGILAILKSSKSDDEIQCEMMDLVGWDESLFNFVATLLGSRKKLLDSMHNQKKKKERHGQSLAKYQAAQMRKKEQREARRAEAAAIADNFGLPTAGALDALCQGLPVGTKRKNNEKFSEVSIPPPNSALSAARASKEFLVPISAFDEWAQCVFTGYKTLNRIQSRLFEAAYHGSGNLLICAPTGAGKTNIALMAILHELEKHINEQGVLDKDSASSFKIVYIAPMKALAQEITDNFHRRLSPLKVVVRELTGDMQLTKKQIAETHILVTTPEKWDVVTRKSNDSSLAQTVRLLIIDEVHLLHEDRGSVIETLVARTLRLVEKTQTVTRIVGLSATLPNYMDVGTFLHADPATGIFRFDETYRPVPLSMSFIGVKHSRSATPQAIKNDMNEICYEKAIESLRQGYQVMVFVHSRRDTVSCAQALAAIARSKGTLDFFKAKEGSPTETKDTATGVKRAAGPVLGSQVKATFDRQVQNSKNTELRELYKLGFAVHHAGMLRPDRSLVERMFTAGAVRLLVCTATLAWGVNLPTHTVIIRGTDVYDSDKGGFVDLGMLDVMQIFGRAGRPQYDTSGEGIIITENEKLAHYLSLLTSQMPIESQFVKRLEDHLNAEIVLGTVTCVREAVLWLTTTYLYVRMCKNPPVYGISWDECADDPTLARKRNELIVDAARELNDAKLIRYDAETGNLAPVNTGRVASHYYIQYDSMREFREQMRQEMTTGELLQLVCSSNEFENLRFREEESHELSMLYNNDVGGKKVLRYNVAPIQTAKMVERGKNKSSAFNESDDPIYADKTKESNPISDVGVRVNLLFQACLSHVRLETFTLVMDTMYIMQNITRIVRGLFEVALHRGWSTVSLRLLELGKMADRRMWDTKHPLRQFPKMPPGVAKKLEDHNMTSMEELRELGPGEIASIVDSRIAGEDVARLVGMFPTLEMSASIQPLSRTILRINVLIEANFEWAMSVHGTVEPFWIWVEDVENEHLYHKEFFALTYEDYRNQDKDPIMLTFTIPIFEPIPTQYYIRAVSDRWLGADYITTLSFKRLCLPDDTPPHTDLQDLVPLHKSVLHNPKAEALFNFTYFNPVQTQIFHTCYHLDCNVLLGAPTGSGKTVAAELACLKLFRDAPRKKVVYIGPLKALVRERMADWGKKFGKMYGKNVVELTGDYTPNVAALERADIVCTTPEKWDGVTRNWKSRSYVRLVGLVVIDEIHMLGADRGPVLEVIVSRMRYISEQTHEHVRIMGLSTAVANAQDLVDWLGVPPQGVFNFKPAVRPVPLEVHIVGFPGRHYCPRMESMNKPAYTYICTMSATKPVIVFVSSRRQTRLTAIDLIAFSSSDEYGPRNSFGPRWLRMSSEQLEDATSRIHDSILRQVVPFGIGVHHAGLSDNDRSIVETLFRENKIQVLVSTSTLAWGVNLPAHLVIVKGTEFFDAKKCRWVDMPVTDILQMMGRAGRPQFDTNGKAVILVEESKKPFYYKFLYQPFPVESSLATVLHDHLNAEICGGTIRSRQDALDYLTWTYFFRRCMKNPSFYGLSDTEPQNIAKFLSRLIDDVLDDLGTCKCVEVDELTGSITPLPLGKIAAYYYIHFTTVALFDDELAQDCTVERVLDVLCDTAEYDELPVRHSEDETNERLAEKLANRLEDRSMDDPHTKAHLLFQAHMQRAKLPITDYVSDTKSVLDQAIRICQAMLDVSSARGWLSASLSIIRLLQLIVQACWISDSPVLALPCVTHGNAEAVAGALGISMDSERAASALLPALRLKSADVETRLTRKNILSAARAKDVAKALAKIPTFRVTAKTTVEKSEGKVPCEVMHVTVMLEHTGGPKPTISQNAYAPRFPKLKQAGYIVLLANEETGTLLALKRVVMTSATTRVQMTVPSCALPASGKSFTLFACSDSYYGVDQSIKIPVC